MAPPDYPARAARLLAGHDHDDADRARRIAGLYAALWLEDPFRFRWCGLAAWVALQVHRALSGPTLGYRDALAGANLRIWESIAPDLLRFRDGVPIRGPLAPGFVALHHAEGLLVDDPRRAETEARAALLLHAWVEQRDVVQPVYDRLSPARRRGLRPLFAFRLGMDSAAPTVAFPGDDPTDLDERLVWVREAVLPAWYAAAEGRFEELRADADRLRRAAGVTLADLDAVRGVAR